jgi:predicted anti-sigma-YlaC factor YlaD
MKSMGINRMADALSSTASSYSRDDDPEFVRMAAPSTLKMVEMLLDEQASHPGLLNTACSGFAQYAYAFLHLDAEMAEPSNAAAARDLRARAVKMYDRARDYCLRALEVRHPGFRQTLARDVKAAMATASPEDVPALFYGGAAWAGSLALAENPLARIGDLGMVRALLGRAVALDESWQGGAIHEAMIAVEGVPALLGGSPERARAHFDRAVSLSNGTSAFAYVTMASSVSQPAKNRAEFERLLRAALAIDVSKQPAMRLSNLIAQKRARFLLSQVGRLF